MATSQNWSSERASAQASTKLEIITKVPSKWRFVDLETGEVWRWATPEERARYQMLGHYIRDADFRYNP